MKINLSEIIVSEVKKVSEIDAFPKGVTFFEPYLKHDLKETLEAGGEAYLSKDSDGVITGRFMYDGYEEDGTIYTKSREVFDQFFGLKEFSFLYSELKNRAPAARLTISAPLISRRQKLFPSIISRIESP